MDKKNMTALVSCFARAYHTKKMFKIYDDPLAEKVLGEDYEIISNNMKKGILFFNPNFKGIDEEALEYIVDNHLSPSVLGRSAFASKALNNSKMLGAKQYLILASGYDTSFSKNKELKVFEVDTLEMIDDKKRRLDEADIDYSNVEFIGADFTEEKWVEALRAKFDCSKKTFCSMLGISYYLNKEQFECFLNKVASLLCLGSEIVMDYPNDFESEKEKVNQELAKAANEEMKSKYSYEEMVSMCENNNLLIYEYLDSNDMTNTYFSHYNSFNPTKKIIAPKGVSYCLLVKR